MSFIEKFFIQARDDPKTEENTDSLEDALVSASLYSEDIDRQKAMEIPAYKAAVDTIAGTVAALPIRLYKKTNDSVVEVKGDKRVEPYCCRRGWRLHRPLCRL